MSKFTFKKSSPTTQTPVCIEEGVHVAQIVQVAYIGMQLPYDRDKEPEEQMAVAFEVGSGDLIAKRMKFSKYSSSFCYHLFDSAFPDLDESDEQELGLADLLGKSVLIEIEVRDGQWPRVTGVMPLEPGFESFEPKTELLEFDADEIKHEVYLKLHPVIRDWYSRRVRHA